MVSFPIDVSPRTFIGIVTSNFGTTDPLSVRMWGYDNGNTEYVEVTGSEERPASGAAYWLIRDQTFDVFKVGGGVTMPLDSAFVIDLPPGYSMVASPFPFRVSWDDMRVGSGPAPDAVSNLLVERPLAYLPDQNPPYEVVSVFEPFAGYWINNISGGSLALRVPPREPQTTALARRKVEPGQTARLDWQLHLSAFTERARDAFNYVGVHAEASDQRDIRDREDLPGTPGQALTLYFPHENWEQYRGHLSIDIRNAEALTSKAGGQVWQLDIAKDFVGTPQLEVVTLQVGGVEQVPADMQIILLDRHLNHQINLRKQDEHRFSLERRDFVNDDEDARFLLLIGGETFVAARLAEIPSRTALQQNFPNPFNPTTVIRYDIAHNSHVKIAVFDVSGRLVRTLVNEPRNAGGHEIVWNGLNERGQLVATGIYFYRLTTGSFVQTRKMVMLK
jgi:hypothetical protein